MNDFRLQIQDLTMKQKESRMTYLVGWVSILIVILAMYLAAKYFGFR